jgi:hypothetical protein
MRPHLVVARSIGLLACWIVGCSNGPVETPDAGRVVETPDAGVVSLCLDPATPGGAYARCRCNGDCEDGSLCDPEASSRDPGGACLRVCTTEADCGENETCRAGAAISRCVPTCSSTADCGAPGRYCFSGRCFAVCQADSECESGNCDRHSGRCLAAGVTSMGAETSEACLRDEDCRSGLCNETCLTPCARSANGCPAGEFCLGDDSLIDLGQCLPICETTADCADPAADCLEVTDLGRTARVCL